MCASPTNGASRCCRGRSRRRTSSATAPATAPGSWFRTAPSACAAASTPGNSGGGASRRATWQAAPWPGPMPDCRSKQTARPPAGCTCSTPTGTCCPAAMSPSSQGPPRQGAPWVGRWAEQRDAVATPPPGPEADPQAAGLQRISAGVWERPQAALQLAARLRGAAHLRQALPLGLDEHRDGLLQEEDAGDLLIVRLHAPSHETGWPIG